MDPLGVFYSEARVYSQEEAAIARQEVTKMSAEELQDAYVDMVGMVAYYTRLEGHLSAKPRMHFDALRLAMRELEADKIIEQAAQAAEQGMEISGTCRVKAKPLLSLLQRVNAILG